MRYIVITRCLQVEARRHKNGKDIARRCEFGPGDAVRVRDQDGNDFRLDSGWVTLPKGSYRPVTDTDFVVAWQTNGTVEGTAQALGLEEPQARGWERWMRRDGVRLR